MSELDKTSGVSPKEVSFEDAQQTKQLMDLLAAKAEDKLKLQSMDGLHLLKKSKFYYSADKKLREHIASFGGYAIMLKQEKIKEDLNDKEVTMFPTLVTLKDLKKMKKVNGNVVRKLQPQSIHEYEKMALINGVILQIESGV